MTMYSLHSTPSPLSLTSSAVNGRITDVKMVIMWTVLTAVWSVSYLVSQWKKYHPITTLSNICKYCPVPNNSRLSWLKALVANWAGHLANLYFSLIGFHPRRLKGLQGISYLTTDLGLCGIFFFYGLMLCIVHCVYITGGILPLTGREDLQDTERVGREEIETVATAVWW